jgi:hypothetical protein
MIGAESLHGVFNVSSSTANCYNIHRPVVQEHPELFEKFIVMNSPHGKVMAKAVRNGLKQLFKSWVSMAQSISSELL